jgi:quinol monooxygenase YgiN
VLRGVRRPAEVAIQQLPVMERNHMTLKAIVELKAKPGRRNELLALVESMYAAAGTPPGFIGTSRHASLQDPDTIIEINTWQSPEQFDAFIGSMDPEAMSPLMELLAEPFRRTLAGDFSGQS